MEKIFAVHKASFYVFEVLLIKIVRNDIKEFLVFIMKRWGLTGRISPLQSMAGSSRDDESCTEPLGRCSVFYYGVGHMLNDITSACWFTYLLVFLTDIGLPPRFALYQFPVCFITYYIQNRQNDVLSIEKKMSSEYSE